MQVCFKVHAVRVAKATIDARKWYYQKNPPAAFSRRPPKVEGPDPCMVEGTHRAEWPPREHPAKRRQATGKQLTILGGGRVETSQVLRTRSAFGARVRGENEKLWVSGTPSSRERGGGDGREPCHVAFGTRARAKVLMLRCDSAVWVPRILIVSRLERGRWRWSRCRELSPSRLECRRRCRCRCRGANDANRGVKVCREHPRRLIFGARARA